VTTSSDDIYDWASATIPNCLSKQQSSSNSLTV